MRLRVAPLDIIALAVLAFVIVLPPRSLRVETLYRKVPDGARPGLLAEIASAQARLAVDPGDGAAAESLADLLGDAPVLQHDQAQRVADEAASHVDSPSRWRALRARSSAHADRCELAPAHADAIAAMAACQEATAACPAHEAARLAVYVEELDAAARAAQRGADPCKNPAKFRSEMQKLHPTTRPPVRIRK